MYSKGNVCDFKDDPILGATFLAIFSKIGSAHGTGRDIPPFNIVTSSVSCLRSIFNALWMWTEFEVAADSYYNSS